jgi:hypothetical protein
LQLRTNGPDQRTKKPTFVSFSLVIQLGLPALILKCDRDRLLANYLPA